ncbi:hypothetical protein LWI28_015572 [Acer negundo]|uniref:CCHC-type domain-containing protein n=1 Tax=Acer negundo TaxID=4023 RepID=A0AAD5I925_ACENE|nr:hypothetical protein LWI28_015572 [Acer negundo]
MDDLRQQIHQLQQRLHLYDNHNHKENDGFEDDSVDVNPFHQMCSHVSDDSTPHPHDLRYYGCFKCQRFGHITSECPNHKIISLVKEDSDEDDLAIDLKEDEYENEEVVEDVTYGDEGASLVIQRSLSVV